jgi:hypothetical protein
MSSPPTSSATAEKPTKVIAILIAAIRRIITNLLLAPRNEPVFPTPLRGGRSERIRPARGCARRYKDKENLGRIGLKRSAETS